MFPDCHAHQTRCAHCSNEPPALLLLYVPADLVGRPVRFTVAGPDEGYKTQRDEDRVLRRLLVENKLPSSLTEVEERLLEGFDGLAQLRGLRALGDLDNGRSCADRKDLESQESHRLDWLSLFYSAGTLVCPPGKRDGSDKSQQSERTEHRWH